MSKKVKKTNQNEETELELAVRITNSRFRSQGISLYKEFDTKMREAQEEDGEIRKLHLWEQAGPNAINVMFQILKEVRLGFAKGIGQSQEHQIHSVELIRLWKVGTEDEGVHSLCQYLLENPDIEVLDLLDNKISYLGCNYMGKVFRGMSAKLNVTKVTFSN